MDDSPILCSDAPDEAALTGRTFMSLHVQGLFFEDLIRTASSQAGAFLVKHGGACEIIDPEIASLQLSPLLDRQLLAISLRLASNHVLQGDLEQRMIEHFRSPASSIEMDVQRRSIENEVKSKGLPMELALNYTDALEQQAAAPHQEIVPVLWSYATLYEELWSDPRLGAPLPTRRIMLAMKTALRVRSADLAMRRCVVGGEPARLSRA